MMSLEQFIVKRCRDKKILLPRSGLPGRAAFPPNSRLSFYGFFTNTQSVLRELQNLQFSKYNFEIESRFRIHNSEYKYETVCNITPSRSAHYLTTVPVWIDETYDADLAASHGSAPMPDLVRSDLARRVEMYQRVLQRPNHVTDFVVEINHDKKYRLFALQTRIKTLLI